MTGAMYAAIAGLRTHMQNMNVIGNNIANVNTAGYKSARAVFRTSIYTTLSGGSNGTTTTGGMNPSQIGYGANVGTIDIDMSTGNYSITGKPTDCMIDGDGFFLVGSKTIALNFTGTSSDVGESGTYTSLTLTRVGDFDIMPDGYLAKDDGGDVVYGFLCVGVATQEDVLAKRAAKVGDPIYSDQLVPIRVPRVWRDAEGAMHIGYPRAGGGVQEAVPANEELGTEAIPEDPNLKDFEEKSKDGKATAHLLDYGSYMDANGEVVESEYSMGYFSNITINQNTGVITATCRDLDDQVITIGCLAIGTVTNPNGVTQIGNSMYKANQGSGELRISALGGVGKDIGVYYVNGSLAYLPNGAAADAKPDGKTNMPADYAAAVDRARLLSGDAEILTNGLEMSKTDLAQEIANMIVTQRGYQANTRIITVTDSMLEELVNMKR